MQREEFNELVQQARQADLFSYFQQSGYSMEKHGNEYYVKEVAGLCVNPSTNQWYHHYTNQGGTNNALDCLTKILDRSFNQAVFELTGRDVTERRSQSFPKEHRPQITSPPHTAERVKKELQIPAQAPNMRRLFAYLCQSRKIPAEVVEELVHAKLLYQSDSKQNSNAVFVHRNTSGEICGAELQGLNSYKRFKGVATGTGESVFQFTPVPSPDGKIKRAYLFESAIDLMSFYTFCDKRKLVGATLVSMAGLKPTIPKQLREQEIGIISCVDNDDAGRRFEAENDFYRPDGIKEMLDEHGFKDWNELLIYHAAHPDVALKDIPKIENPTENLSMSR